MPRAGADESIPLPWSSDYGAFRASDNNREHPTNRPVRVRTSDNGDRGRFADGSVSNATD
ncbi:hypothetical protein C8258_22870 [Nocardia sp. MDA0666]|nr:hypothetical protein C8258_22870 [Nocardia sp. MDA0666]